MVCFYKKNIYFLEIIGSENMINMINIYKIKEVFTASSLRGLIETLAIERLQALGFDYIYGPDIAPDSANPERESFADVLLLGRIRNAVARINPTLPRAALDEAIKSISVALFNMPLISVSSWLIK